MKNAKMPIQGEGVIRNANRSHIEGGVEASGIFGDLLKGAAKIGIGLLPIPGAGIISSLI